MPISRIGRALVVCASLLACAGCAEPSKEEQPLATPSECLVGAIESPHVLRCHLYDLALSNTMPLRPTSAQLEELLAEFTRMREVQLRVQSENAPEFVSQAQRLEETSKRITGLSLPELMKE